MRSLSRYCLFAVMLSVAGIPAMAQEPVENTAKKIETTESADVPEQDSKEQTADEPQPQDAEEPQIQNLIKESHARIVTVNKEFFVLEKTGRRHEIEELREAFNAYGIMQFVRSGRIAVTKDEMKVSELLEAFKNQ